MLTPQEAEALIEATELGIDTILEDEEMYSNYLEAITKVLQFAEQDDLLSEVQKKQREIVSLRKVVEDEKTRDLAGDLQYIGEEELLKDYEDELDRMLTLGAGTFSTIDYKKMPELLSTEKIVLKAQERIEQSLKAPRSGELRPAMYRVDEDGKRTVWLPEGGYTTLMIKSKKPDTEAVPSNKD